MKPSTAKTKGRATEAALVDWLRSNGYPHAERRRLTGTHDQGDITGIPGLCVEVKSGARPAIPQWLAELDAEIVNADAETGVLVIRPKGRPDPTEWWAIQRLPAWFDRYREQGDR